MIERLYSYSFLTDCVQIAVWLNYTCVKFFLTVKLKQIRPQPTAMRWHLYWGENGNLNINVIIVPIIFNFLLDIYSPINIMW